MQAITAVELAYRIAIQRETGDWIALITSADRSEIATGEILNALGEAVEDQVTIVDASRGTRTLTHQLLQIRENVAVVTGMSNWTVEQWQQLDGVRSRLTRKAPTVLVISEIVAANLEINAPNFASWVGGNFWTWIPNTDSLSVEETERRLDTLRTWAGKSDAEIIALAERGDVALGPQYVEWLVLLGKGDLIAPSN
jgi:hypothetical protein